MRRERDRFVALAFCWADVLFELDAGEKVAFAAGPTAALLGAAPEALTGRSLDELIAAPDRALVRQLLGIARKQGRIENVTVRLQGSRGPTMPLTFAGYRLDELEGHYFLALRMGPRRPPGSPAGGAARDVESGLYEADSFAEVVHRTLSPGAADSHMTLIALPGFEDLRGRLDEDAADDLMSTIGACLRASSVDGDAAARIADDRFGLLHGSDLDVAELELQIAGFSRDADPAGHGVAVQSATVEVDRDTVSGADLANGLIYTINCFRSAKGTDFDIKSLSTSLSALATEASRSVNSFRRAVAGGAFDIAFQPIIDVVSGEVHHYEALCRFHDGGTSESPYQTITFAEETGLISEFDLAMARKVVDWLSGAPRGKAYSIAVNVSGHSVGSIPYIAELHALLKRNLWTRRRLPFEITESARMTDLAAANRFIQGLRGEGYQVCLDDFGAGAANFQYLSTLEVDVVKLDGSAVHNAQRARKGRAFLKALVGLCADLDVDTIAEMVDDKKGLEFVRDCGVHYVQGYLFGKPSTDITAFATGPPRSLFPGRRRAR